MYGQGEFSLRQFLTRGRVSLNFALFIVLTVAFEGNCFLLLFSKECLRVSLFSKVIVCISRPCMGLPFNVNCNIQTLLVSSLNY